jgi:hypothetical protein
MACQWLLKLKLLLAVLALRAQKLFLCGAVLLNSAWTLCCDLEFSECAAAPNSGSGQAGQGRHRRLGMLYVAYLFCDLAQCRDPGHCIGGLCVYSARVLLFFYIAAPLGFLWVLLQQSSSGCRGCRVRQLRHGAGYLCVIELLLLQCKCGWHCAACTAVFSEQLAAVWSRCLPHTAVGMKRCSLPRRPCLGLSRQLL